MIHLKCVSCKTDYLIDDGIPVLLPPKLDKFKTLEAEFHTKEADEFVQHNMKFSYRVLHYHEEYLSFFRSCKKGAIVLEVGCGGGLEAVCLKKMELKVIESDISVGMVKTARKRALENDQEAESVFIVCDAEQLPCQDQSLDAILIVGALHHLPSPARFFAAARAALKPGGMLVIGFEPNQWPYFTVYPMMRLLGKLLHPNRRANRDDTSIGDIETTGFTADEFELFLYEAGLKKISLQRIWYLNGFIHTVLAYINRKRPVDRLIDLPHWLQRALVSFDNVLSTIPIVRRFCWHWTLVAKRPEIIQ